MSRPIRTAPHGPVDGFRWRRVEGTVDTFEVLDPKGSVVSRFPYRDLRYAIGSAVSTVVERLNTAPMVDRGRMLERIREISVIRGRKA